MKLRMVEAVVEIIIKIELVYQEVHPEVVYGIMVLMAQHMVLVVEQLLIMVM